MSPNHVGLTEANALSRGGENLGAEAQGLRTQLNNLITDMARDKDVLRGDALAAFRQAQRELTTRFDELVRWCDRHGVQLGDAQSRVNITDQRGEHDFGAAGSQLSGLVARMNR